MRYLWLCFGGVEMHDAFKKTINSNEEHTNDTGNEALNYKSQKQLYFINYQEKLYAQQEVENYIAIMIIALIVCFCLYLIGIF